MCDRLLRQLVRSQLNRVIPIWSCQSRDSLVAMPAVRGMSFLASPDSRTSGRSSLLYDPSSPPLSCVSPSSIRTADFSTTNTDLSPEMTAMDAMSSTSNSVRNRPKSVLLDMESKNGLPHLTVPLPSRNEPCLFTLKPVTHTVGDFLSMLRTEDAGIDRAVIRTVDGVRIASTTSVQTLLSQGDFELVVNDTPYRVSPPKSKTAKSDVALGKILREQNFRRRVIPIFSLLQETIRMAWDL